MDKKPREQVVEHLQTANNVLVTLSRNPSVDQLAACIGLTLLLNKLGKHATAVFSGQVPSTLEFLQPEKTLQKNTDSLRDFIIALDKSKADKLRYKVEDEVVKIFITPYRTNITEKDLQFGQGDFNVDVVMALGVHVKEDLDQAIITHGRILHDATVISVNNTNNGGLGSINWIDEQASSLCEMLAAISQDLNKNILDSQIATAFLTGIVAETERFSNQKVNPNTMSLAGVLMAAGANSQLVANKLEQPTIQPAPIPPAKPKAAAKPDGELNIVHDEKTELPPPPKPEPPKPQLPKMDTEALNYSLHAEKVEPDQINIDESGELKSSDGLSLPEPRPAAQVIAPQPPPPAPVQEELPPEPPAPPVISKAKAVSTEPEPEEEKYPDDLSLPPPEPHTAHILKHGDPGATAPPPQQEPPKPIVEPPVDMPPEPTQQPVPIAEPTPPPQPLPPEEPTIHDEQTLSDIEEAVHSPHLQAPAEEVNAAISSAPPVTPLTELPPVTPLTAPEPPAVTPAVPTTDEAAATRAEEARAKIQEAFNTVPSSPKPLDDPSSSSAPPQGPPPIYPIT